jgi:hypothetical protein
MNPHLLANAISVLQTTGVTLGPVGVFNRGLAIDIEKTWIPAETVLDLAGIVLWAKQQA